MERILLKSKIHRSTVTDANLNYEGSISVCPNIIDAAKLVEFEKVDIYNINNGERISTYVIKGKCEEICLNGAAARQAYSIAQSKGQGRKDWTSVYLTLKQLAGLDT